MLVADAWPAAVFGEEDFLDLVRRRPQHVPNPGGRVVIEWRENVDNDDLVTIVVYHV